MMGNDLAHHLFDWFDKVDLDRLSIYLVGGAVRDIELRRIPKDIDIACSDAAALVLKLLAKKDGIKIVTLDKRKDETCHRIVDKTGVLPILDVTQVNGGCIDEDLLLRDFTLNAMARRIQPDGGLGRVIDPTRGRKDIRGRLVRMTGPEVFGADPLRLLRAIRVSVELEFTLEVSTRQRMLESAPLIRQSSVERVRYELYRILEAPTGAKQIALMDDLGLLEVLIPEIAPMKGCRQNHYHHLDVWEHTLEVIRGCGEIIEDLESWFGVSPEKVRDNLSRGHRRAVLLLAALLHDVGKPTTRSIDAETARITFYGHEGAGAETAATIAQRLKMSNDDTALLARLVSEHMRAIQLSGPETTEKAKVRFFRKLGDDCLPLLVLGMADIAAARGIRSNPEGRDAQRRRLRDLFLEYFATVKPYIERPPLITGKDLIAVGFEEGPQIGRLLRMVEAARDDGRVRTRQEAFELAKTINRRDETGPEAME